MAYRVYQNGENLQQDIVELVADNDSDIESLPTRFGAGSKAIALNSGVPSFWMLGVDKVWYLLSTSSGGGSTGSVTTATVQTMIEDAITTATTAILSQVAIKSLEIVETLPSEPETDVLYLTANGDGDSDDVYNEWMYLSDESRWELMGRTQISLTDYYTKEEVADFVNSTLADTLATTASVGMVKPDGETLVVDEEGTLSVNTSSITVEEADIYSLF